MALYNWTSQSSIFGDNYNVLKYVSESLNQLKIKH